MEADPLLIQGALSAPVVLALALYTLLRRDRSTFNRVLAATLFGVVLWMSAEMLRVASGSLLVREVALHVEFLAIALMPPLFLITMGLFARMPQFERSHATWVAALSVFGLFALAFVTDPQHHLFFRDRELAKAGGHPLDFGGPLFWSLQAWCTLCNVVAIGVCLRVAVRDRFPDDRRRALTVLGAILFPVFCHWAWVVGVLPFSFSLAPGALAISAVFVVHAVSRYGLLEPQPIVRHDVLDHMHDAILLADQEGLVLDANQAAEALLGQSQARLRNRDLAEILAGLEPVGDLAPLAERLRTLPLDGGRLDGEIVTGDGRTVELSAGAVSAKGAHPAGRFLALRDRSEHRRSERLLRERQKLESVGILAAGVAHEVNNPLSFVRANLAHLKSLSERLEKVLDVDPGSADAELLELPELIEDSLEGVDRIARIVDGMLRFSRVSNEESGPVDPEEVIDEALRLAALHRDRQVEVHRIRSPQPLRVLGSPERLVQVLLNLLLNARQALSGVDGARIDAETRCEGPSVVIEVRDNGPGIPEEHRNRVFDAFFTTRPPDEGTGLGLHIAFDLVREHGGTLELGECEEAGTCFRLRLPRLEAPEG